MMKYIFNHMQDMAANNKRLHSCPFQDILFLAILRSESVAAKEKADKRPKGPCTLWLSSVAPRPVGERSRSFHRGSIGRTRTPATHSSPRIQANTNLVQVLPPPQRDQLKHHGQEDRYRHRPRDHLLLCGRFPAWEGEQSMSIVHVINKRCFLLTNVSARYAN